ncbi:hypothetical protein VTG60DRAFT_1341 [Thermothelomyces hinnuleus]
MRVEAHRTPLAVPGSRSGSQEQVASGAGHTDAPSEGGGIGLLASPRLLARLRTGSAPECRGPRDCSCLVPLGVFVLQRDSNRHVCGRGASVPWLEGQVVSSCLPIAAMFAHCLLRDTFVRAPAPAPASASASASAYAICDMRYAICVCVCVRACERCVCLFRLPCEASLSNQEPKPGAHM